jgi:hypothetical protein
MRIDGIIRKYGDRFENGSSEGWTVGSFEFDFLKFDFYLLIKNLKLLKVEKVWN